MENLTIEQKEKELRGCGVMCHIADIEEAYDYAFVKGWDFCEVDGQLNSPDDDITYYDIETGKEETI